MARPDSDDLAVNGDEVRDVRFRRIGGYDASEVDELLRRIAVELDAGRLAGPLIVGATFREVRTTFPHRQPWAYDYEAVDWFLEQLQRQEDHSELGGMGADPWRDLPVGNYFTHRGPDGLAEHTARPSVLERQKQARQDQEYLHQECEDAWRDFGQQPGTRLRWVRTGVTRRELRTPEHQTIASLRALLSATVSTGGRTFTWKRVTGSSWTGIASSQKPSRTVPVARKLTRRKLLDETGTPVLYTIGRHFDHGSGACITFPDQRWLEFPVQGALKAHAIMTAVDQDGNKVAQYRAPSLHPFRQTVEITVHPDWDLTDELVLVIAISAPWFHSYFKIQVGGG